MQFRAQRSSRIPLQLRRLREGVVAVRASNDTVVDSYGTVITVESLMADWWAGFQQHRTVSLQHNYRELRGIGGKAMVGVATRADFTPQLEVEIKILDPDTWWLVEEGKISSASLEFVPTETRMERRGGVDAAVYYRLSSEPELCGLSLVDIPAVPGADALSLRGLQPSWGYAVVDPAVLAGQVSDPATVHPRVCGEYWGLAVVLDGRTSRICQNLRGVVLPADDPFWSTHVPPLHYRCRTALVTYSREQAETRGVTRIPPNQPPLEGFGAPVGRAAWSPQPTDYHPDLWAAYQRTQTLGVGPEQERAREGVHFSSVTSAVSRSTKNTVLRAAQRGEC